MTKDENLRQDNETMLLYAVPATVLMGRGAESLFSEDFRKNQEEQMKSWSNAQKGYSRALHTDGVALTHGEHYKCLKRGSTALASLHSIDYFTSVTYSFRHIFRTYKRSL